MVMRIAVEHEVRARLAQLADRDGKSFAMLSRLLGRGQGYVARYIAGTPAALAEHDRRTLAAFFGVDAAQLGAVGRRRA